MITVIHGGQSGVDRGAHDAAIDNDWNLDGYMPLDCRDEFGCIPAEVAHFLTPHSTPNYADRTEANVRASHAALIIVHNADNPNGTPGTGKTIKLVLGRHMPHRIVDPTYDPGLVAIWIWKALTALGTLPLPIFGEAVEASSLRLLVAGPRESKWTGARIQTASFLRRVNSALTMQLKPSPAQHETR